MNFLIQAARLYQNSLPEYSSHFLYDFMLLSEKKMIRMYLTTDAEISSSRKRSTKKLSPFEKVPKFSVNLSLKTRKGWRKARWETRTSRSSARKIVRSDSIINHECSGSADNFSKNAKFSLRYSNFDNFYSKPSFCSLNRSYYSYSDGFFSGSESDSYKLYEYLYRLDTGMYPFLEESITLTECTEFASLLNFFLSLLENIVEWMWLFLLLGVRNRIDAAFYFNFLGFKCCIWRVELNSLSFRCYP